LFSGVAGGKMWVERSYGVRFYARNRHERGNGSGETLKYTEDDLLRGTVEANGFKILGEGETHADIPKWEKVVRDAFEQMRFADAMSAYENIRGAGPNAGEMFSLYMRSLDALGSREDDIINSYQDAQNLKIPLESHVYAKVMKALFRRGEKSRVISIFERMQENQVPGTPEVFATLLSLYYQENPADIESARGILATMKKNQVYPSTEVIDRALLFFVQANSLDLIVSLYKEFVQEGSVKPQRIILSIMTETMLLKNEPAKAQSFLNLLYAQHKYPRLRTYELLIESFLQRSKKDLAEQKWTEMVYNAKYKATLAVYKSFFRFYEKRGDYEGLQRMLEKMVKDEAAPDAGILESMLQTYFANRKDDEYMATFVTMLDRQMMPKREFWTKRMKILAEDEDYPDFAMLLKEYEYMLQVGLEPTKEELRMISGMFHRCERPDLFERFAETEMLPRGVQYDLSDYSLLMRSYAQVSNAAETVRTYERFMSSGLVASEPHVFLLQCYISWNNVDAAFKLYQTEILPSLTSGKYLLDSTQLPRLLQSFTYLGPAGLSQFVSAFETLVPLHAQESSRQQREYLESKRAVGKSAKNAMRVAPIITSEIFEVAIHYLASINQIERAISVFGQMKETYHIGPSRDMYANLLEALAKSTDQLKSNKYFSTLFNLFSTYLFDPAMVPHHHSTVAVFILFLIRHGNQEAFSNGIYWYKELGQTDASLLTPLQAAGLRKWIQSLPNGADDLIPEKFTSRNLEALRGTITPSKGDLDWRHNDVEAS